jgi:NitT/TauT family transport system permease protein
MNSVSPVPPADESRSSKAGGAPVAGRRRRANSAIRHMALVRGAQLLVGIGFLGAWELAARTGVADPFFVSQPSKIAVRLVEWFGQLDVYEDLEVTLLEAFLSIVIGGVLGLVIGFLFARLKLFAEIMDPYITMANSMPRLIFAPLFLLWFGIGIWSKVALGVSLVFFIIFFNTYQGIRDVDRVLVDNTRMLGASERDLFRHVFLPSALTWIFASLHVSVGFAIIGAVVGEYLGSSQGIGYRIAQAEGTFNTTSVFAGLTLLAAVVFVVDILVYRVERYLLRWKATATSRGMAP